MRARPSVWSGLLLLCTHFTAFSGRAERQQELDLLHVLEYDGRFCWEPVDLKDPESAALIEWALSLSDRLTSDESALQDLMIPWSWWIPHPASELRMVDGYTKDISLSAIILTQLAAKSGTVFLPKNLLLFYQLSLLPDGPSLEHLYVTTADNFWRVVEATNATRQLTYKRFPEDPDAPKWPVISLEGYVILLGPNLAVHGQESWQHGSHHLTWNSATLHELLKVFLDVAGAHSIPSLDESAWRHDKVALYKAFQKYAQNQGRQHHAQPIPSAVVAFPEPKELLVKLCRDARYNPGSQAPIPPEHLHATALSLLRAVQLLEADSEAQQIQRSNQGSGNSPRRKYFLKRNYATLSQQVSSLTLVDKCSWETKAADPSSTDIGMNIKGHEASLHPSAAAAGPPSGDGVGAGIGAGVAVCAGDMELALKDAQQLFQVAEQILRHSCTEEWLLQPYISDMKISEYRVYLIGGAQGDLKDAVPVYTPMQEPYPGGYKFQLVPLPAGYFTNIAYSNETGQLLSEATELPLTPPPAWKDEAMHALLVQTAATGAAALAASGHPFRSGERVLLRVDVALTHHEHKAKVYINEAHQFNDAVIFFEVWPPRWSSPGGGESSINLNTTDPPGCATSAPFLGMCASALLPPFASASASPTSERHMLPSSRGLLLASKLWQEIVEAKHVAS